MKHPKCRTCGLNHPSGPCTEYWPVTERPSKTIGPLPGKAIAFPSKKETYAILRSDPEPPKKIDPPSGPVTVETPGMTEAELAAALKDVMQVKFDLDEKRRAREKGDAANFPEGPPKKGCDCECCRRWRSKKAAAMKRYRQHKREALKADRP